MDMLSNEALDVVVLVQRAAFKAGYFSSKRRSHRVGKPMATRYADGLRMVEACDEAGVKLSSSKIDAMQHHNYLSVR